MKIQILGAGLDVGRSCLLATIASRHILLDCGAHHAFADKRRFPDFSSLPVDTLSNIECILVTHFHFDHAAALPFLTCNHKCKAPIYMTEPTLHLTSLMLHDFLSTSATRQHACPFNESDVRTMLSRVKILDLEKPTTVLPSTTSADLPDNSVTVTAYPAGHTLGAVMLYVRAAGQSLLYSGDYSLRPDRVLPTAALPPSLSPHVFVTEATYCSSVRSPIDDTENEMIAAVLNSLFRRGKVLFPVSAFGRVHAICASLSRLALQYPLHEVPAYVVSGTTTKALDIYNRYADDWMVQPNRDESRCIHCQTAPPQKKSTPSPSSSASSSPSLQNAELPQSPDNAEKEGEKSEEKDNKPDVKRDNHEEVDEKSEDDKLEGVDDKPNVKDCGPEEKSNPPVQKDEKPRQPTNDDSNNKNRGKKRSRTSESCSHGLLKNLRPFNRTHDWHVIDEPGPVIMFATPANLSTGISRQVFQAWCTHPDNLVVMPSASFATSVAANSLNDMSNYNSSPQVRCKIVNSLSACHPDSADILRICRHVDPKSVMLIHGEQTKVLAFRQRVEKFLDVPCFAPANGEIVDIGATDILSQPNPPTNDKEDEADSSSQLPAALVKIADDNGIALS